MSSNPQPPADGNAGSSPPPYNNNSSNDSPAAKTAADIAPASVSPDNLSRRSRRSRRSHSSDKSFKEQIDHIDDIDSLDHKKNETNHEEELEVAIAKERDSDDGAKLMELKRIVGEDRELQERRLLWKIDLRLLPMLMVIYVLNYLDRTNIATARLDGLEQDTGLHGTQYNTIISVFYVGYVLTQVFSNMILNKVRPSILLPAVMIGWATVSSCSGAVQSYGGWIALRFILGFVESPYFAGSLFLLSSWYTKKELATRISILYTASQMSGAFGGLIGQAILTRFQTNNRGIAAWRWLFIIEGTITVPVALMAMFILPDYPHNTKFLNEKEKALAQLRMLENASKEDTYDESMWTSFQMCLTDPTLYMLLFLQLSTVTAATVNTYFPTIVETLGYDRTKTLLLTAPPWFFSAIFSCLWCLHSDKTNERFYHIIISLCIALVGFIICASTMQIAARYVSMFLMLGIYGGFNAILSWIASCMNRPAGKRAVAYALINAFSNLSSVYASYFYPASTGPRYLPAMACNIAFTVLAILTAVVLRFYLVWRNKKLDQASEEDLATEGKLVGKKSRYYAAKFHCDPHYRFAL